MADTYRVVGVWLVKANSQEEAENLIENAIAKDGDVEAELDDCNAEIEE